MGMGKSLAKVIGWFFKLLGVTFDLKDLWRIVGGGGGIVMAVNILSLIKGLPLWGVILICLIMVLALILILAIIQRKKYYSNRIQPTSSLLKGLHKRIEELALGKGQKRLDANKLQKVVLDFAGIVGIPKRQLNKASETEDRLNKRTEDALIKRVVSPSIESNLLNFATLLERYNIGLRELMNKDFRYNYLKGQLDNLYPMPTVRINEDVATYLENSYVLNSLLMVQKPLLDDIDKKLSTRKVIDNLEYKSDIQNKMNRLLSGIEENIKEYLRHDKL